MCTAILTVASAIGSVVQGRAQQKAANAQASAAEQNARLAEQRATDAVKRGGIEELRMRREMSHLQGRQRAIAAASGLSPDTGSMLDVQMSSINEGERDIAINEYNSQQEAWGHTVEAVNQRNAASAARASGKNAFMGGLFGAGTSLLSLAVPKVDTFGNGIKVNPNQYVSPIGPMDTYDSSKIKNPRWA